MTRKVKKEKIVNSDLKEDLRSGEILINNSKKLVEKAKKQLEVAHEIEAEKIKQGYEYMKKDKTAKLIHPDKIKQMSKDGWELVNKKNKSKKVNHGKK